VSILADSKLAPAGALPKAKAKESTRLLPIIQRSGRMVLRNDLVMESGDMFQKSPDGHYWSQEVDNAGSIATADEGVASPADA
jgi:hypothetical protein